MTNVTLSKIQAKRKERILEAKKVLNNITNGKHESCAVISTYSLGEIEHENSFSEIRAAIAKGAKVLFNEDTNEVLVIYKEV